MTWDTYNRRKNALHEVLAVANRRSDISVADALDSVPGARDAFTSEDEFLLDAQMYWASQLSGQLELLVGTGADTPEVGVISAWVATAATAPGARRLLDAHADHPALAKAFQKEEEIIARAAGVPAMSPRLLERGRAIADAAREQVVLPELAPVAEESPSLLSRLRSALAA